MDIAFLVANFDTDKPAVQNPPVKTARPQRQRMRRKLRKHLSKAAMKDLRDSKTEYVAWRRSQHRNHRPGFLADDPAFRGAPEPTYQESKTQVLTAKNEYMEGTAIYELKSGIWAMGQHSATLAFLKGKSPAEAKLELLRRGFEYQWT